MAKRVYHPNQPMSEADVEDINHAINIYAKWHHLFQGWQVGMDKDAIETMFKPSVGSIWPHVYDVAHKAGQKYAKRWVYPSLGFAAYGFVTAMVEAAKIISHLLQ